MRSDRDGTHRGTARSAFIISALLCVASPALSSEAESPTNEAPDRGSLGRTTIRVYGAVVPVAPEETLLHAGWGTGLAISYGVARAIQISLGLGYYRFQLVGLASGLDAVATGRSIWDEVRQTTMSVDIQSPTRLWLRPWFGAGFGVYEMTETRRESYYSGYYRYVESGTRLGVNWGAGVSARLDHRLGIDLGGRYHHSFGRAFMTNDQFMNAARLLSVQAGLSYVIH